jgi:hypothetical protein
MAPRLRTLLALLALAAPLAPRAARAAPSPLAWPGPLVRAGDTIELTWRALPGEAEELEVLLSLDDGRSFTVRVSPEIEARERRYRWRVPALATGSARLRIRYGVAHGEIETEPTAAFRIAVAGAPRAAEPLFREDAGWPGADAGRHRDAFARGGGLDRSDPAAAAAAAPPRTPAARTPRAAPCREPITVLTFTPRAATAPSSPPLRVPLRV